MSLGPAYWKHYYRTPSNYSNMVTPQPVITVCPRCLDQFYMVSYLIKWVVTSWTESIVLITEIIMKENLSSWRIFLYIECKFFSISKCVAKIFLWYHLQQIFFRCCSNSSSFKVKRNFSIPSFKAQVPLGLYPFTQILTHSVPLLFWPLPQ